MRHLARRLDNVTIEFQFTHPGKGATNKFLNVLHTKISFNSRTLGRVRLLPHLFRNQGTKFQFTHPGKGATPKCCSAYPIQACFNSRTLGRVRPSCSRTQIRLSVFQFTHPGKGATFLHPPRELLLLVSIHAPWEGCDSPPQSCRRT